jgi:hypothetical protein
MKKVWKCDFCHKTSDNKESITKHRPVCSFNPSNKTCYTCRHRTWVYEMVYCMIEIDVVDGGNDGNCKGWEINL